MFFMKSILLFLCFSIGVCHFNYSQGDEQYYDESLYEYENSTLKKGYGSAGLGIGLNYGGFGGKFGYNVADKVNLFTGIGYNLNGLGFNAGVAYDYFTINRTSFYFSGMGGYNAVTAVEGAPEYTETFYGISFGTGFKMESKSRSGNYWEFGIILPIRNRQYGNMLDDIRNDPRIVDFSEPWPILISVGYNAGF